MVLPIQTTRRRITLLTAGALAAAGCVGCSTMSLKWPRWSASQPAAQAVATDEPGAPQNAKLRELTDDESSEVCLATARELEAHGKELAAIEQYERARAFRPKTKGVAARLAVLYDRQGNHERAGAEYATALGEDSKNADVWNDFAYFQFERERFDEAEKAARKALKLDGEHKRAWVNLGLIVAELERYDEAYEAFTHAVSPAAAHNNVGIILARHGRVDEARRHLAQARQIDPTLRQPQAVLAYLSEVDESRTASNADRKPGSSRRADATTKAATTDGTTIAQRCESAATSPRDDEVVVYVEKLPNDSQDEARRNKSGP